MPQTREVNLILDIVHGDAPVGALREIGVEFSVTQSTSETVISTRNPKNLGAKVECVDIARGLLRALDDTGNPNAVRDWATAVYHCSCFEFDVPDELRLEWLDLIDALYTASITGRVNLAVVRLAHKLAE